MQRRARPAPCAGHARKTDLMGSGEEARNRRGRKAEAARDLVGSVAGDVEQEKAAGSGTQPRLSEELVGENLAIAVGGRKRELGIQRNQRALLAGHLVGAKAQSVPGVRKRSPDGIVMDQDGDEHVVEEVVRLQGVQTATPNEKRGTAAKFLELSRGKHA